MLEILICRSDGENRKSFVVFEDGVDSGCSKSNDITTGVEITVPPTAGLKNGKFKTLKSQVSESQTLARESVQQNSKYHSLESLPAFRARAKGMLHRNSDFTALLMYAWGLNAEI